MKTRIEKIGPTLAKSYIESNYGKQRNLSESHVVHLAQQMKAGQWECNGEPIIFDENNNLIDGQHRLNAIIRSGVEIDTLVVSGVKQSAFVTINSGKSRSNSDVFSIKGTANYNNIATCVNGVMNYRRALKVTKSVTDGETKWTQIGGSLNASVRPSKIDMVKEYERHADKYQQSIHLAAKSKKIMQMGPLAIVAAMGLIDGSHQDFVEPFFIMLANGIFPHENHPAYKLKYRFEQNKSSRLKLSSNMLLLLTAKAWNLYALEKECKVLRVDSEIAFAIH
jgi:hypothetical protein